MADLGERGRAFYEAYCADRLPSAHRSLVQEAARILDTLDQLAALATGEIESWAKLEFPDGEVTLTINGILAERRQQQLAFKQLLMEIRITGLELARPDEPKDEMADDNDPGAVILKLQQRAARAAG